jgi:chromate transporter
MLSDFLSLFLGMLPLSLLSIGGAITVLPALHALVMDEHSWMDETTFSASVAIAQAAPGPNILFIAVIGWHAGLGWANKIVDLPAGVSSAIAAAAALAAMLGIVVPSSALTYFAGRWVNQNGDRLVVRAFKSGMAPIVVALLTCAGWLIASNYGAAQQNWGTWMIAVTAGVLVWRTRLHLLFLLAAGAAVGALGWV